MEKIKNKLVKIGYTPVVELPHGMSLVNEEIKICIIILLEYDTRQIYDSELRDSLDKYNFSEKGTICIFINHPEGTFIDKIEADEYHAIKVHYSHIDCIPHRKEDITITFEPLKTFNEFQDSILNEDIAYVVNPLQKMDGLLSQDFYRYLSKAKDGDIVKYPLIIDGMGLSWFRYIAGKFYNTKVVK